MPGKKGMTSLLCCHKDVLKN